MKFAYQLPSNGDATPYTVTISRVQNGDSPNVDSYSETQTYRDGLGRAIAMFAPADPTAGDTGDWVVTGEATYDTKGATLRAYDARFVSGSPTAALGGAPAVDPLQIAEYDAFGRSVRSYGYDHSLEVFVALHALSNDVYDAADFYPTTHQGTYATSVSDGHGRGVARIQRIKVGSSTELRSVLNSYLPSGERYLMTQRRAGAADVVRWAKFDSLGRMVMNVEPNTSTGFNPNPATPPDTIKAWRYAYNDAGSIVGVSDARGCGANFHYDAGGRLVAEDRSPCLASQPAYSAPNLTTGDGTEAFYRFDTVDPEAASVVDGAGRTLGVDTALLLGRTTSSSSLGSKTIPAYDALGRVTAVGVRIQKPGTAQSVLANRYAPRWYVKKQAFDALSRVKVVDTGVALPELMGADGKSELRPTYTKRSSIRQVAGSYGVLFAGGVYLADGRTQSFTLGDAASTQRYFTYDVNQRVAAVQTYRAAAPLWSAPPPPLHPTVGYRRSYPPAAARRQQLRLRLGGQCHEHPRPPHPVGVAGHREAGHPHLRVR